MEREWRMEVFKIPRIWRLILKQLVYLLGEYDVGDKFEEEVKR